MAKKNSRNTDILRDTKNKTSPKVYSLLVELVNEDKEEFAEEVLKIDYLLTYSNNCIKDKDFKEGKNALEIAKNRIDKLKDNNINVEHLIYIFQKVKSNLE